jgi:peptide/nickel transport system permease protein
MNSLTKIAFGKFKRDKLGILGFSIIVITFLVSLFGVPFFPDSSPNANQMNVELATIPPGESVQILKIPNKKNNSSFFYDFFVGEESSYSEIPISDFKKKNDLNYYLPLYNSDEWVEIEGDFLIEDCTFWLGTDKFGRDYLSRILYGSRVSLAVGFISVFISLIIGISLGLISGYFGGFIDAIVMWLVNVVWSIPTLLMVIAISLALGKGFWQVFVAVGLTMWVEVARIVRGSVMSVRKEEYIEASKVLGFTNFRILTKHILPNILAPVIVISAANFASAILIEAGLSFLGIGAQPPIPSWGTMIKDHYSYIIMGKGYLAIFPGLAIMFLVLSFMLLGNAIRDAFDVKD